MKKKFAFYSLFLTILMFGIINGGGLYEEIVVGPAWSASPPTTFALIQEPNGLSLTTFWIPFHTMANIFLVLALILYWKQQPVRNLLFIALGIYLVIRIATFAYFAPTITEFMNTPAHGPFSAELAARAEQWRFFSWIRSIGEVVINVLLLLALMKIKKQEKDSVNVEEVGA